MLPPCHKYTFYGSSSDFLNRSASALCGVSPPPSLPSPGQTALLILHFTRKLGNTSKNSFSMQHQSTFFQFKSSRRSLGRSSSSGSFSTISPFFYQQPFSDPSSNSDICLPGLPRSVHHTAHNSHLHTVQRNILHQIFHLICRDGSDQILCPAAGRTGNYLNTAFSKSQRFQNTFCRLHFFQGISGE